MSEKIPVSFLMITLNDEYNLPGALESIKDLTDEVFIVDSLSTDRTVDVALAHGAHVVQRRFTNFGDHWAWVINNMPVSNSWVFALASDERITDSLKEELRALFRGAPQHDAYTVRWRRWFTGKPLRAVSDNSRLFRHEKMSVSNAVVNEHFITEGTVARLKGIVEHLDSRDMHVWFEKQNLYSTMEAIVYCKNLPLAAAPKILGNKLERRMFLKKHFRKIPFRYQFLFLALLLLYGVWRNGRVGLDWVRSRVMVKRLVEIKIHEIERTGIVPELPKGKTGEYDLRVINTDLQKTVNPVDLDARA